MTGNSISLSQCWRQRGSRYAIRAGRNLPDKEFRYLRTVIVTAAVYLGLQFRACTPPFNLPGTGQASDPIRRLATSQSPVFLINSRHPLVCAPLHTCVEDWALLLANLRRYFAEFLQHCSLKRLGILYQSTCVGFGYGLMEELFPGTAKPPDSIR